MTTEAQVLKSVAVVTTPKAESYLAQLCKHFAHKIPATHEGGQGRIAFSAGVCRLEAADGQLTMTVEGPDEAALAQLRDVMERHLLRFAFREDLAIVWRDG